MKTKLLIIWAIVITTIIGILGFGNLAQAHTPNHSESCRGGATITGSQYELNQTNRAAIYIDGGLVWSTPDFGTTLNQNVAIPQDASAHSIRYVIDVLESNQYDMDVTVSVGPCVVTTTTTIPETTTTTTTIPETTTTTTTIPETTTTTTTIPETTEPETTVPETTEPETTVPETTEPETTVPETTEPETTEPETTEPETTVPETTEPETTEPETTVPETTEPETTIPETPTLSVEVKNPVCDNDVPYLEYRVVATGTETQTVSITFLGANGQSFSYQNQPLSGRVLWPGAVADANGNPLDWPGWTQLADGTWVEGDEWDWVRPEVIVLFEVNPSESVTVGYPPSTPSCLTNPAGETPPMVLPVTR